MCMWPVGLEEDRDVYFFVALRADPEEPVDVDMASEEDSEDLRPLYRVTVGTYGEEDGEIQTFSALIPDRRVWQSYFEWLGLTYASLLREGQVLDRVSITTDNDHFVGEVVTVAGTLGARIIRLDNWRQFRFPEFVPLMRDEITHVYNDGGRPLTYDEVMDALFDEDIEDY